MSQIIRNSPPKHLLILGVVYLVLLFRMIWFVDQHAVNVLFWDQWDFLIHLFNGNTNLWDHFTLQHGPHRQGLGGVIISLLYPLSGWNVRVETFIAVALIAVSAFIALVIKGKIFGKLHWLDSIIPMTYFTLLQYEILIGTPNLAHGPVPLLLVTATAFMLTVDNQILRAVGLVVLLLFTTYTGFAIFSGIVVIVLFIFFSFNPSTFTMKVWNLGALILSIAIFASFFINYYQTPAADGFQFPYPKPLKYLEFVSLQFGAAFGIPSVLLDTRLSYYLVLFFSAGLVTVLIAITVYYALRMAIHIDKFSVIIFYLASFTLLFFVFTAIGRVFLGIHAAYSSRYVSYSIPGIVALYFVIIKIKRSPKLRSIMVAGILVIFVLKEVSVHFRNVINRFSDGKRNWVECYLQNRNIEECNRKANFSVYPDDQRIKQKLKYLEENNLSFFKDTE